MEAVDFRYNQRTVLGVGDIEESMKRRFFAVLHRDRNSSPLDAVRAAIIAEQRTKDQ